MEVDPLIHDSFPWRPTRPRVAENDLAYVIPIHPWDNFPDPVDQSFHKLSQLTVKQFKCCCNVHFRCLCGYFNCPCVPIELRLSELYVKMCKMLLQ